MKMINAPKKFVTCILMFERWISEMTEASYISANIHNNAFEDEETVVLELH